VTDVLINTGIGIISQITNVRKPVLISQYHYSRYFEYIEWKPQHLMINLVSISSLKPIQFSH